MKEVCREVRKEVFAECGVEWGKRKSTHNIHHIVFRSDYKRGLVDKSYPIKSRCNLVVLPIKVHEELHELIERTPAYRNCIESRIWIANYAYNGDLSDLL